MRDTADPHVHMSKEALNRLNSVMTRLKVDENWALNGALDYFDGITEATFSENQDICFLDEKGAPVSVSEKLKALQKGELIELWDSELEPSHYSASDIALTEKTAQTLDRLGAKLNLSRDEVVNYSALFFSSLVTLTQQGKNVAYRDYSDESDVSFSDQISLMLKRKAVATANEELSELYVEVGPCMHEHIQALANELELKPDMIIDGALMLYSNLAMHTEANMDPVYLDEKKQPVSMGATYLAADYEPVHVYREDEPALDEGAYTLHATGSAAQDAEHVHQLTQLRYEDIVQRSVDFFTEVLKCKQQAIQLIAWDEQTKTEVNYADLLDDWAKAMRRSIPANETTRPSSIPDERADDGEHQGLIAENYIALC